MDDQNQPKSDSNIAGDNIAGGQIPVNASNINNSSRVKVKKSNKKASHKGRSDNGVSNNAGSDKGRSDNGVSNKPVKTVSQREREKRRRKRRKLKIKQEKQEAIEKKVIMGEKVVTRKEDMGEIVMKKEKLVSPLPKSVEKNITAQKKGVLEPGQDVPFVNIPVSSEKESEVDQKSSTEDEWLNDVQPVFPEEDGIDVDASQREPEIRQEEKFDEESVPENDEKNLENTTVLYNTDSEEINQVEEKDSETEAEEKESEIEEEDSKLDKKDSDSEVEGSDSEVDKKDSKAEEEVKKLRQNLAAPLEDVPKKQGVLGHLFNWIQRVVTAKPVPLKTSEIVNVKSSGGSSKNFLRIVKFLLSIVIFVVLIFIIFWVGVNIKILGNIPNWFRNFQFGTGSQQVVVQQEIVINNSLLRQWGIKTAFVIGTNRGSAKDMVTSSMFDAYYFGKLKEPTVYKETGMTAAFFFGEMKDVVAIKSRFEVYVNLLQQLKFSSQVNLDQYLNRSVNRVQALQKFLNNTKTLIVQGNIKLQEMKSIIDNYTVSINSLNPDKQRYNTDFFTYMEKGKADAASTLLDNYIVVAQKGVELKAQRSALQKLVMDYMSLLKLLTLRDDAVQSNFDALVKGIKIKEVQGSGVNMIQK